jgi:Trehalose and maltose hydrolases (possible phosphorylases)
MKRKNVFVSSAFVVGMISLMLCIPTNVGAQKSSARHQSVKKTDVGQKITPSDDHPDRKNTDSNQLSATKISSMTLAERLNRKIVPKHGFCSIVPGKTLGDGLISGNGAMNIEMQGNPYSEQILFHHESLLMPWRRPLEAPNAASVFPQVRQMVLDGKYKEAIELAFKEMEKGPIKENTWTHPTVPAFLMRLDFPKTALTKDYLRTLNFENSEANVYWNDSRGEWVRKTFTSRPDNVVVQLLTAPKGQSVNVRITLADQLRRMRPGAAFKQDAKASYTASGSSEITRDFNTDRLIYKCRLDPSTDNSGYAGVVRVVRNGGTARMENGTLVIENAASVMLLTRIEWFADYSESQVEALNQAVEQLTPNYEAMLERHSKVQSEALNRVIVDFGGDSQYGLSSEELLANQRSRQDYSPALLEKIFEMGRYWFMLTSGKYPSMSAEVNANINLQISPGPQGDLREGMDAYFNWMESLAPDFRVNAKNIFGMRGTHYSLWPDKGMGVAFHYSSASNSGEIWPHPYWISAGGWCMRPFWDHYLVTGDLEFLRKHIVPGLKELALFYEDFLTVTDKDGKYIFAPSFSPENWPGNLNTSCMISINATMDISVCREVLTNLIDASKTLGIEADNIPKWQAILDKLPPYLFEPDGTLKEWAWPTLQENYNQRHVSHLYGAWPGDEIDPDRTPKLALGALMADRRRVPERLAAHGRCHRALVGARLKDSYMVDTELRQLIEQGYVGTTFRCSHDPYVQPMPDAQGGIQTIMMEMLAYSRPGVIELLPALPPSLLKGSINGMLARTLARIDKLTWDMDARTVDVTITSLKNQDITLTARQGIEDITAPVGVLKSMPQNDKTNCEIHLNEGQPVKLHIKLGHNKLMDWVTKYEATL